VLEPRSWSLRRNVFQERLTGVFGAADEVIVAPVFRAAQIPDGERLDVARLIDTLAAAGTSARHLPDVGTIVAAIVESAGDGDVVVVMSNGGFDGLHDRLLEALGARASSGLPT
jgi:UDP-N-acetylmuramate: L-alanyl-gamma-D-glutamyl-meso-diaminopimelate ligase